MERTIGGVVSVEINAEFMGSIHVPSIYLCNNKNENMICLLDNKLAMVDDKYKVVGFIDIDKDLGKVEKFKHKKTNNLTYSVFTRNRNNNNIDEFKKRFNGKDHASDYAMNLWKDINDSSYYIAICMDDDKGDYIHSTTIGFVCDCGLLWL